MAEKKKFVSKVNINTITHNGKTYPVTAIGQNAAKGSKKLKSVSIGSNVNLIDKKAFYKCKKLKKVTISASSSLTVNKGAFNKINKDATIKIKGLKGKAKKKLVKKIKKQTDANVK